ncbi:agmatinase family protein [Qiania dongpingensis]|uniref:Agmatinase family protein n=1 Tax=Qiania dongpingensis TaxID=2763669 RepID=A0A7G9G1S1_9FIRM|nr:agmatinase family protein [Qiania dongpingensis]QNM04753.1 agmatinase family protein [Qiania dongpingensis]
MDERILYPSFSGINTFLRAPYVTLDEIEEGDYVVSGVPYDVTIGTRPGPRYAPNAIREETKHFIYHLCAIDGEVVDVCTKKRMLAPPKEIVKDIGDIRVYPTDVMKTTEQVADTIEKIVEKGAFPVTLGGDHYIAYPVVKGFERGYKKRMGRDVKIGYLHIDSHMDMYDENDTWGKYYQGSPARRISELESFDLKHMVFVGLNGTTGAECYDYAVNGGASLYTIDDIRRDGVRAVMEKAIAAASEGCDVVYATIDIDILDQAYGCGTGSYVYGGITAVELLEIGSILGDTSCIGGIDMVEVSPPCDPTGSTNRLAASTLINFLKPRLFEFR